MKKFSICLLVLILTACNLPGNPPVAQPTAPQVSLPPTEAPTATALPSAMPSSPTPAPTFTLTPPATETSTATPVPMVESLDAVVVTEKYLACRYGPGAEYLYLYGLNKGANIKLIGQTGGNNWVMVAGKNLCWINAKYADIKGDPKTLKVVYPNDYKLPVSPYYPAPSGVKATRTGNNVTVTWNGMTLRPGDEEDANMFIYIIEVWRCEGGQIIFDPLAANDPEVTFWDEPGCAVPSHGRVFFQEKHGFAGPTEILFPPQP